MNSFIFKEKMYIIGVISLCMGADEKLKLGEERIIKGSSSLGSSFFISFFLSLLASVCVCVCLHVNLTVQLLSL